MNAAAQKWNEPPGRPETTEWRPRGACPSLSAPMATGDGLLARLSPRHGELTAAQLGGIARAARRHGNGRMEITSRGSLQIRGLSETSAPALAIEIAALGIAPSPSPEIRIDPLGGIGTDEIADPRPLADALEAAIMRAGLSARLAPKLAMTVDGGGKPGLRSLVADLRLEAVEHGLWRISLAGDAATARQVGSGDAATITRAVVMLLERLAASDPKARGRDPLADLPPARDLGLSPAGQAAVPRAPAGPVSAFPLRDGSFARGFAPVFGQLESGALARFADRIKDSGIRFAPRALLVTGLDAAAMAALEGEAESFGLIARPDDPRLKIAVCVGAPACASGHLETRPLAAALAAEMPDLLEALPRLHLAACAKQCAKPAKPLVSVVGAAGRAYVTAEGVALTQNDETRLAGLTRRFGWQMA